MTFLYIMKNIIEKQHLFLKASIALVVAMLIYPTTAWSQLQWGDQGNGTFINPVLNADYSDPDVIRVGDKYYMVASDFHFMGMQVLESTDMINWRIVSQVFDHLDYPGWDANQHFGGGSWAPSIRWHNGRFYVYFCTYEEGLFMSSATDAHGPWEPLHCLREIPKWEDPCPFWDEDGQAYLGRSRHRAGPIIVHKMSADGRTLLDDGVTVYTGPVAEGTKFLKRNGYYYLIIPEGGVGQGWQTVLRSRNIYGPYEKKMVLEQGSTPINGPHQGALVDTPNGEWWFYHFQESSPRGRIVHLQPARWNDDWPLMGVDIDGNSIGEPVYVWKNPLPSNPLLPQTSDEFNGDELFWVGNVQRALGVQWQWNHNPDNKAWSLTSRKGWLTMKARHSNGLKQSRNMLTQKTMGYQSVATVKMDCSRLTEGTFAGLLCTGKAFMGIGVCIENGKRCIYLENDGKREIVQKLGKSIVYLRINVDSQANIHRFAISYDGKRFSSIGKDFPMQMGSWKGTRVGLFCYNTKENSGEAMFDFFRYQIER